MPGRSLNITLGGESPDFRRSRCTLIGLIFDVVSRIHKAVETRDGPALFFRSLPSYFSAPFLTLSFLLLPCGPRVSSARPEICLAGRSLWTRQYSCRHYWKGYCMVNPVNGRFTGQNILNICAWAQGFSLLMFGGTIWAVFSRRSTCCVNRRMLTVACLLLLISTAVRVSSFRYASNRL